MVDHLPRDMITAYLSLAHPEARDAVVDYFGWKLSFRASIEGSEAHDSSGELTWHTAITIPHYLYLEKGEPSDTIDLVREKHKFLEEPSNTNDLAREKPKILEEEPGKFILDVSISLCITGDGRGLFWSSSLLGARKIPRGIEKDENEFGPSELGGRMRRVMEKFKYDRYAARNLVFVSQLASVCHIISERLEKVMTNVKEVLDGIVGDSCHYTQVPIINCR